MEIILYLLIGVIAGISGGLFGIGGGIVIIPALVYFCHLTQQQAQGTTLAILIPPIGLLAAWVYFKNGNVDLRIAAFICLGFFIGGFFGAKIASVLSNDVLKKLFGILMLLVALKMVFGK
jgi:hypothetical protein